MLLVWEQNRLQVWEHSVQPVLEQTWQRQESGRHMHLTPSCYFEVVVVPSSHYYQIVVVTDRQEFSSPKCRYQHNQEFSSQR